MTNYTMRYVDELKRGHVTFIIIQCSVDSAYRSAFLSCRRQMASRLCKIIRYMQHCYGTGRFIMYIL